MRIKKDSVLPTALALFLSLSFIAQAMAQRPDGQVEYSYSPKLVAELRRVVDDRELRSGAHAVVNARPPARQPWSGERCRPDAPGASTASRP